MADMIYAIMKHKRGTYEWFESSNPTLADGQIGIVTGGTYRGMFKIGNGTTAWRALPWGVGEAALNRLGLVQGTAQLYHGNINLNGTFFINGLEAKLNALDTEDGELAAAIAAEAHARQQADTDHANLTTAHGATATPTADRIAMYGAEKGLKSDKVPAQANDVIRKTDLDAAMQNLRQEMMGILDGLRQRIEEIEDVFGLLGTMDEQCLGTLAGAYLRAL